MSEHLNVGDVTSPRWAGGTRNPEKRETVAERAWREHPDEMARAHTELQVAVLREQLAAAEARAVHAELEWAAADARTVLAEAAKADAWDEGARYVTADSTYTEMFDIPKNPYRRTGDTNA